MLLDPTLSADLVSPASTAYLVLVLDLDAGRLVLADRPGAMGCDTLVSAVLAWGSIAQDRCDLTVESQALPAWISDTFWVRRSAQIWQVVGGLAAIEDGQLLFEGVVEEEPSDQGGVLTVQLGPPRLAPVMVPDGAPIDTTTWPQAADSAIGKVPPEVFGTVERCALLAVAVPPYTTLSTQAEPGQTSLAVADATALPNAGTVVVDGVRYAYTARTDTGLLGLAIAAFHRSGTAVALVGATTFLAAGHAISALTELRAGEVLISDGVPDLTNGLVSFDGVPTTETVTGTERLLAQFDAVDASSTALNGINAIRAATGSVTQSAATGSFWVEGDLPVTYAAAPDGSGKYLPLSVTVPLRAGVVAGTYTFIVQFDDNTKPENSHRSSVWIGGIEQVIDYTKPSFLAFSVPLTAGQSSLTIQHSQVRGAWPFDSIDPTMDCTIKSVSGSIMVTDGRPTGVTGSGVIVFARPAAIGGTDRIISGTYLVSYTVTVADGTPAVGRAFVKLGGALVWAWDAGTVIYAVNPATVSQDANSDQLPVEVTVEGAARDAFRVDVTAASRTIVLGNIDGGNWATLRKDGHETLAVNQTTDMASRGRITKAQLVVEFWSRAAAIDRVAVTLGGIALGNLAYTNDAGGGTVTKTIATDTVSSVSAALATTTVSGIASSPASAANVETIRTLSYSAVYTQEGTSGGFPIWVGRCLFRPPANVLAGVHNCRLSYGPVSGSPTISTWAVGLSDGAGSKTANQVPNNVCNDTVTVSDNTTTVRLFHQILAGFGGNYEQVAKLIAIEIDWRIAPVTVSGGGFTGSPSVASASVNAGLSNQPAARVDGVTGTGNLQITQQADPRSCINTFDLPMAPVLGWSYFTGKQAKLVYGGAGTLDVCPVQVYLAIDYQTLTNVPATALTATIVGKSGNPADVLGDLAARAGETVLFDAIRRYRGWCASAGYALSCRIDSPTDVTSLMNEAASYGLAMLAARPDGLAMVRQLDTGAASTVVATADLLAPATLTWTESGRRGNELVLQYRPIAGSTTRVLTRGASADRWARKGEQQLGARQRVEMTSQWIASDAVATQFAADWLRLNAPMRRTVTLQLPYSYADLWPGDLITCDWIQGVLFRVTTSSRDGAGFVSLTADEVPQ